jgi:hypothetical protein
VFGSARLELLRWHDPTGFDPENDYGARLEHLLINLQKTFDKNQAAHDSARCDNCKQRNT